MIGKRSLRAVPRLLVYCFLLAVAVMELYPVLLVVLDSFKSTQQFYFDPLGFPKPPVFDNLINAFQSMNYLNALKNNLIILVMSMVFIIFCSSLAAYPIAKKVIPLKSAIYTYFIAGMALPTFTALAPLLNMLKGIGLANSYVGMTLVYTAGAMPFTIMFYTGFYKSVPAEIEEAAQIDGASMLGVYWRIYMPLLKTPTATICILQSVSIWNDFLYPYVFLSKSDKRTLMPALYAFLGNEIVRTKWETIFPAMFLTALPLLIVFLIANKSFIKGMTEGAVKG